MFTRAIIKEIPATGDNIYKVDVPVMSDNTGGEAIFDATLCTDPSTYNSYKVGDAVFVTFEDDLLNDCVIVGKLYTTKNTNPSSYSLVNELKVTGSVELPESTKIGKYTAEDFSKLYNSVSNAKTIIESGGECHWFILKKDGYKWNEISSSENDRYYKYILTTSESKYPEYTVDIRPELYKVTGEETPTWDIVVDPDNTTIPYKTQIKYRAWCTTCTTYPGAIEIISMNAPEHDIILEIKGLNLGFNGEEPIIENLTDEGEI